MADVASHAWVENKKFPTINGIVENPSNGIVASGPRRGRYEVLESGRCTQFIGWSCRRGYGWAVPASIFACLSNWRRGATAEGARASKYSGTSPTILSSWVLRLSRPESGYLIDFFYILERIGVISKALEISINR